MNKDENLGEVFNSCTHLLPGFADGHQTHAKQLIERMVVVEQHRVVRRSLLRRYLTNLKKMNESYITDTSRRKIGMYYLEDFAEQFSQFNDRPGERTLVVVSSAGILQHKTRVAIHLIAGEVHHGVQCKSTWRNLT